MDRMEEDDEFPPLPDSPVVAPLRPIFPTPVRPTFPVPVQTASVIPARTPLPIQVSPQPPPPYFGTNSQTGSDFFSSLHWGPESSATTAATTTNPSWVPGPSRPQGPVAISHFMASQQGAVNPPNNNNNDKAAVRWIQHHLTGTQLPSPFSAAPPKPEEEERFELMQTTPASALTVSWKQEWQNPNSPIRSLQTRWKFLRAKLGETQSTWNEQFQLLFRKPYNLLPHQELCVRWLLYRERTPWHGIRGGVGFVEMGLGKTLIALALSAIYQPEQRSPSLIVIIKPTRQTWKDDVMKFFGSTLRVLIYSDRFCDPEWKKRVTKAEILRDYDIVIITYSTLVSIFKRSGLLPKNCKRKLDMIRAYKFQEPVDDSKVCGSAIFYQTKWYRAVFDESSWFSNPKSLLYFAVRFLQADRKSCMSGTPFKNAHSNMWAQLTVCGMNIISVPGMWNIAVYQQYQMDNCLFVMDYKLAKVTLPERHDRVLDIEFRDANEAIMYQLMLRLQRNLVSCFQEKTNQLGYMLVLTTLNRLRQLCIAPFLICNASKRKYNGRHSKSGCTGTGNAGGSFELVKSRRRHKTKCYVEDGEEEDEEQEAEKRFHRQLSMASKQQQQQRHGVHNNNKAPTFFAEDALMLPPPLFLSSKAKPSSSSSTTGLDTHSSLSVEEMGLDDYFSFFEQTCQDLAPRLQIRQLKTWIQDKSGTAGIRSEKIRVVCERIYSIAVEKREKILLFSNYVSALDLVMEALSTFYGFKQPQHMVMITGADSDKEREWILNSFQQDPTCMVMAGHFECLGTGLNLTHANHVFILDPKWQPFSEQQAFRRCQRLGQTKPVFVYRAIRKESIESRILEINRKKQEMSDQYRDSGLNKLSMALAHPSNAELDACCDDDEEEEEEDGENDRAKRQHGDDDDDDEDDDDGEGKTPRDNSQQAVQKLQLKLTNPKLATHPAMQHMLTRIERNRSMSQAPSSSKLGMDFIHQILQ